MKMFSDCSGECCVCACGDFCLAGHGDDDFRLATKEQLIDRLNKGKYEPYTNTMIGILEDVYGYKYKKNKYTLRVQLSMTTDPNGDVLWDVIKDAFLSYAKKTDDTVIVYDAILEEVINNGSIKE